MKWHRIAIVWIAAALVWAGASQMWSKSAGDATMALSTGFSPCFPSGSVAWEDIDRVEITRDGVQYEFVRNDSQWVQVKPFEFPLDQVLVQESLEAIASATAQSVQADSSATPTEVEAATGIGVNAPRVRVSGKNTQATLLLGRRLPAGFAWVGVGTDEPVARAARATVHDIFLASDLRQWRRGRLFERADVECDGIRCAATAPDGTIATLAIERVGPSWMVTSPARTRADTEAVERWLDALARAGANGFVADSPRELTPFGLNVPRAWVEIRSTRRSRTPAGTVEVSPITERLEIGAPVRAGAGEHFARLSAYPQAIMELDAAAVAAATPPVLSLIDPTATGLRPEDIRALRIEPPQGDAVRIERMGDQWSVFDQSGARGGDPAAIASALDRLCTTRASEISMSAAPADLLLARVVVESFDGRDLATLAVSRESGGGRWGIDDGSGVLRIFPAGFGLALDAQDFELLRPGADPAMGPGTVPPSALPH